MRHGWSLDKSDWRTTDKDLVDRNWRRAPFIAVQHSMVPEQSGVYVICSPGLSASAGLFGLLYNALYVGQATDLHSRFLQHRRTPGREIARMINCFRSLDFWYTPAPEEDLNSVEATLIECLGPPANQQAGIRVRVGTPERI